MISGPSYNRVILIGLVGRIQVVQLTNEKEFCRLGIGTRRNIVNEHGAIRTILDWHMVTLWGSDKVVNEISKVIKKGDYILIEGHLRYNDKGRQQGKTSFSRFTDIIVEYWQKIQDGTTLSEPPGRLTASLRDNIPETITEIHDGFDDIIRNRNRI
jgi:single-stranded DNA-binding protein